MIANANEVSLKNVNDTTIAKTQQSANRFGCTIKCFLNGMYSYLRSLLQLLLAIGHYLI